MPPTRAKSPDPRRLDVAALAREGAGVDGETALSDLPRLAASVLQPDDGAAPGEAPVRWQVRGEQRLGAGGEAQTWLLLTARASVWMQCQRCLNPVMQPLAVDRALRFVATEEEAARLDEESEEDVLALQPRLDVLGLVEDELILALPIVARHDACPKEALAGLAAATGPAAADVRPDHPFAVLEQLKAKR